MSIRSLFSTNFSCKEVLLFNKIYSDNLKNITKNIAKSFIIHSWVSKNVYIYNIY